VYFATCWKSPELEIRADKLNGFDCIYDKFNILLLPSIGIFCTPSSVNIGCEIDVRDFLDVRNGFKVFDDCCGILG